MRAKRVRGAPRPHPIIAWMAARMRASPATSKPSRATLMENAGKLASPPAWCLAPQPPSPQERKLECGIEYTGVDDVDGVHHRNFLPGKVSAKF